MFARYAYPPNELGYCGPPGARALLSSSADEIARRARAFEGAWAYLEFLAGVAGTADPLDERVVEAYWVGGPLLDAVVPERLVPFLRERFAGQLAGGWAEGGARAVAHHSFHVFEVYPWAALLRRTGHPHAASVLDRCRIRTGVVRDVRGETATVTCRPLVWDGERLTHGPPRAEVAAWSASGRTLLDGLAPGDRVSLHWDWVCDLITTEQATRIEDQERLRLA
ncbi:hypothetical protein Areg01_87590 [Actinoplanes regularis]|nr:hypothetical protein Areg01_87590 [Actinoplanes regularis]